MEKSLKENTERSSAQNPGKAENRFLTVLRELWSTALGFGKAQMILFGVNFVVVTAGMLVAGMKWWSPLIAFGVSLFDLLPVVGSGVVFVPWAVVALLVKNVQMAITVGATYIAMVVLRMVLDPIITGKSVGLPPLITLLASLGGLLLFGGAGVIVGPVIAAVANVIFRVVFRRKNKPSVQPANRNGNAQSGGSADPRADE